MLVKLFDETCVSFPERLVSRADPVSAEVLMEHHRKQRIRIVNTDSSNSSSSNTSTITGNPEKDAEYFAKMIDNSKSFVKKVTSFKNIREEMYNKGLLERDERFEALRRQRLAEERAAAERAARLKKEEEEEKALRVPLLSQSDRASLDASIKEFL